MLVMQLLLSFVNKTVNDSNVIMDGIFNQKIKESEERSIQSVQQENIFKKVMIDNLFKKMIESNFSVPLITIFYIVSIIKHIFFELKKIVLNLIIADCQLIYVIYLLVLIQWSLK